MSVHSYIGIPYKTRGRMIDALDCWGLCLIYSEFELNKQLPQYMYDIENNLGDTSELIVEETALGGRWKKVDTPNHGDILIFRIKGAPIHCGIYLQDGCFLHTLKGRASCIEKISSIDWANRLEGVYRFNG